MKIKKRVAIALLLVSFLWILFIWGNSMQPGSTSGSMSGSVTEKINEILKIFGADLSLPHLFIRKAAHFIEFAMLSFLLSFSFYCLLEIKLTDSLGRKALVLCSLPTSIAVASIDESIQLFVDGRVGSVTDVMIDTSGAVLSSAMFFLALLFLGKLISKRK